MYRETVYGDFACFQAFLGVGVPAYEEEFRRSPDAILIDGLYNVLEGPTFSSLNGRRVVGQTDRSTIPVRARLNYIDPDVQKGLNQRHQSRHPRGCARTRRTLKRA